MCCKIPKLRTFYHTVLKYFLSKEVRLSAGLISAVSSFQHHTEPCPTRSISLFFTNKYKSSFLVKKRCYCWMSLLPLAILDLIPNFFIIKPTRCTNFTNFILTWNSTCLGQFLCQSSGVYSLYTQQWHMSYSCRAELGWNWRSILVLLESCLQTCMTYTIAECTVNKLLMMDRRTVWNM